MMKLAARVETPESKSYQKDEAARLKHAEGALKAFRVLVGGIASLAGLAVVEFPNSDDASLIRRGKAFTKLAKANPLVQAYLDKWIGTDEMDPAVYSWRNTVVLALRDHLVKGVSLREAQKSVGRVALGSFQAITMHGVQAPLREALPSEIFQFLPKSVVVSVDPKGKITEVTDRFKNEFFTLSKKAEQLRLILSEYNNIAATVKSDLSSSDENTRMSALITSIIMETGIRPGEIGNGVMRTVDGNDEFVETFGAATLGPKHIKFVRNNFAQLEFLGKKGSINTASLTDAFVLKVLNEYVQKALKSGSAYVFVAKDGTPYSYKNLELYFKRKFSGINPTDFRKLRATQEVLNAIIEEQGDLYERIRKLKELKKEALKESIVAEILTTLNRAIERAGSALSHESTQTTIDSYIYPGVLFKFLSTGRLENNLSSLLETGKTELRFDPEAFLLAAMASAPSPSRVARRYVS